MAHGFDPSDAPQALDQLLHVLCRSLPAYLADAQPWAASGDQRLLASLDRLAADRRRYARRVAEAIASEGGRPDPGSFPSPMSAKNDLAVSALRSELIDQQERDIATIERCAAALRHNPSLHAMAEEILGNARGHLELLKETERDG